MLIIPIGVSAVKIILFFIGCGKCGNNKSPLFSAGGTGGLFEPMDDGSRDSEHDCENQPAESELRKRKARNKRKRNVPPVKDFTQAANHGAENRAADGVIRKMGGEKRQ